MTTMEVCLLLAGVLILLVVIGVRVAFATALIGFIGMFSFYAFDKGYPLDRSFIITLKLIGQIPHSKTESHVLALIPTFILIGYLAYFAGFTRALFEAAKRWVGWLPGGLGVSTVFATAGFAAVSGMCVTTHDSRLG